MKTYIIPILFILMSCQATDNKIDDSKKKYTSEELLQRIIKNAEESKLKNASLANSLSGWARMLRNKFEFHFRVPEHRIGESVKVQIFLNDDGYIKGTKIISSTGNLKLEEQTIKALISAQPFVLTNLSEEDKLLAKKIILTFKPS